MGLFVVFKNGVRETKTPTSIRRLLYEYKTQRKVDPGAEEYTLVDEDDDHIVLIRVTSLKALVSELENVMGMITVLGVHSGWL